MQNELEFIRRLYASYLPIIGRTKISDAPSKGADIDTAPAMGEHD